MAEELQHLIKSEEEGEITLHQVLMSLRSKVFYNCTIFSSVNKHLSNGNIIALCHSGYEEEVNKIIANIVTVCKEQFSQNTTQ